MQYPVSVDGKGLPVSRLVFLAAPDTGPVQCCKAAEAILLQPVKFILEVQQYVLIILWSSHCTRGQIKSIPLFLKAQDIPLECQKGKEKDTESSVGSYQLSVCSGQFSVSRKRLFLVSGFWFLVSGFW